MTWTHAVWLTLTTPAAQLATLNLHIAEVAQAIGNEVSADGKSRGSAATQAYLRALMDERRGLLSIVGGVGGGVSLARFSGRGGGNL